MADGAIGFEVNKTGAIGIGAEDAAQLRKKEQLIQPNSVFVPRVANNTNIGNIWEAQQTTPGCSTQF